MISNGVRVLMNGCQISSNSRLHGAPANCVDSVRDAFHHQPPELTRAKAKQAMAIKRHETGMIPADFDATLADPMRLLGAHTQMAIEERADGDPSDRKYLINRAHLELAMLRSQTLLPINEAAMRAGMGWAEWPARLQRLDKGALVSKLPAGSEVWVDGGHNPAAGRAIADHFRKADDARPLHIVLGMLSAKDAAGFIKPFAGRAAHVWTVPIADHAAHSPAELAAMVADVGITATACNSVTEAITALAAGAPWPPLVLVTGSLYLAGAVLAQNGQSAG